MDEAINRTRSVCFDLPQAASYVPKLYSTAFSDPSKLAIVACEAARLSKLSSNLYATFYFNFCIVSGFIGMLSSILALLAYSLKEFSGATFYYFRAISILDFFYILSNVIDGFKVFALVPRTLLWQYVNDARMYLVRFSGKSAHVLVVWLAFDRSVACTRPVFNDRLGKKRFVFKVIAGIFAYALILDFPQTYFDIRKKYFNETRPDTGLAIASHVQTGTEGALMLIFTTTVIVGLIRMSKRKRKLMGKKENRSTADNDRGGKNQPQLNSTSNLIAQIKTNQSLCILQLCEAVPFLFTMIAVYMSYLTNFLMIDRDAASPVIVGGTYEENLKHQWMFAFQTYVKIVVITIGDVFAHGFHFFNYLAFSPKFRRAVIGYLRGKARVVTVQGPQN